MKYGMEHVVAWIMDHDGSLITMVTLSMEHIAIEDIEHDVDRNTNTNTSTTTRLYWYYSSIHIYNNNTLLIPNNTSVTSNSPLVGGLMPPESFIFSQQKLYQTHRTVLLREAGSYWQLDGAFLVVVVEG